MNTSKALNGLNRHAGQSATAAEPSSTAAEPASEPSAPPPLAPGRVRTVSYRRLKNLGNFENEVVEVEGFVFGSEIPDAVLDELRNWVFSQLSISLADMARRERDLLELDDQLWDHTIRRDQLAGQIERMREWLKVHGAGILTGLEDPLPF